jgi:aerobic carbon-monoxide dehydrogenase large subunit
MDHALGSSPVRIEDERLVTGRGRFTDDIGQARELHMVVVRSPHAHARISSIDVEAALASAGVVAVATSAELRTAGVRGHDVFVKHPRPNGEAMFVPERLALAEGTVRFVGDPVAAVFAETRGAARDAADLCQVDYEPLPCVTDVAHAVADGAATLWTEAPGNRAFDVERGNGAAVDAALADAATVVAADMRISRVTALPLEPRAALAEWDQAEQRFTLTCGTHTPHQAREALAKVFGLGMDRIRVVAPDLGGSFGMREGAYPEYIAAMWGARALGRPVRFTAERSESMAGDYHGRDNLARVELALDAEGCFTGLRVRTLAGMGAYLSLGGSLVPVAHVGGLSGVYRTPAIHTRVTGVYANTSPTAPYRGAGRPEAIYALERIIDIAAARTGMDRVELRRRNLIPAAGMPWATGFLYTYDSGDFAANMDKALAAADWSGFAGRRDDAAARGRLRGIGLANSIEPSGGGLVDKPFGEGAEIRFSADGRATVLLGTKSHGQGHETLVAQLMAHRFALSPDKVRVVSGDTDLMPNGTGSFASRTTAAASTALMESADRVVRKASRIAAHQLEAAPDDIEFSGGRFVVAGTDRSVTLAQVCAVAHDHFRLPPGEDMGLRAEAFVHAAKGTFPTGCHVCEVEIDPETGETTILRYVLVDDVGRVLHPGLVAAQLHGGIAQGVGQAMMEEIRYDEGGQLLSGSLMDYALPRAGDLPMFETVSNPTETRANPLGVKGVGEAGTVGALPAFANAVMDALSVHGIDHLDRPLTPQRIWAAIDAARADA